MERCHMFPKTIDRLERCKNNNRARHRGADPGGTARPVVRASPQAALQASILGAGLCNPTRNGLKLRFPQHCPHFKCQVQVSGEATHTSDRWAANRGSPDSFLRLDELLERSQNSGRHGLPSTSLGWRRHVSSCMGRCAGRRLGVPRAAASAPVERGAPRPQPTSVLAHSAWNLVVQECLQSLSSSPRPLKPARAGWGPLWLSPARPPRMSSLQLGNILHLWGCLWLDGANLQNPGYSSNLKVLKVICKEITFQGGKFCFLGGAWFCLPRKCLFDLGGGCWREFLENFDWASSRTRRVSSRGLQPPTPAVGEIQRSPFLGEHLCISVSSPRRYDPPRWAFTQSLNMVILFLELTVFP